MLVLSLKALAMLSVAVRSSASFFDAELKHHSDDPEKKMRRRHQPQSDAEPASEQRYCVLDMVVSLPLELGIPFSGCRRRHSHSSSHSPILSATPLAINWGGMMQRVFHYFLILFRQKKSFLDLLRSVVNSESVLD